jgi:uncharacterized repeat protein (TIGR03803 family)
MTYPLIRSSRVWQSLVEPLIPRRRRAGWPGRRRLWARLHPTLEQLEYRCVPSLVTLATFNGTNSSAPVGLAEDSSGNLYGAASSGGANGNGTLFELKSGSSAITTLAAFNAAVGAGPQSVIRDGNGNLFGILSGSAVTLSPPSLFELPAGSSSITSPANANPNDLIVDSSGNLYGTTAPFSSSDTVFELPAGSSTITTLATFSGSNGSLPTSLIRDRNGNLFGTTNLGGANNQGTVFEVPAGSGTITTIAAFNGANGSGPTALVEDSKGNLFGLTGDGDGTVFEVAVGSGSITTLATFNGSNGQQPGNLIVDSSGNLFGTTRLGGANNDGVVFEVPAGGGGAILTFATFNGANGAAPNSFIRDSSGNFFGTTGGGGPNNDGTVFELPIASIQPLNLPTIANQYTNSVEQYTHFITNAYETYVKRAPTQAELNNYWLPNVPVYGTSGGAKFTDEQIEAQFLSAPEFINDNGGATGGHPTSAWVTAMYQQLLNRAPAQSEVNYWLNQLSTGETPYNIALGFTASQERESNRVQQDYMTYLGRSASTTEVNYWANQFESGAATNEDVEAGFLSSAEYFNDSAKGQDNRTDWIAAAYGDVLFRQPQAGEITYWLGQMQPPG